MKIGEKYRPGMVCHKLLTCLQMLGLIHSHIYISRLWKVALLKKQQQPRNFLISLNCLQISYATDQKILQSIP